MGGPGCGVARPAAGAGARCRAGRVIANPGVQGPAWRGWSRARGPGPRVLRTAATPGARGARTACGRLPVRGAGGCEPRVPGRAGPGQPPLRACVLVRGTGGQARGCLWCGWPRARVPGVRGVRVAATPRAQDWAGRRWPRPRGARGCAWHGQLCGRGCGVAQDACVVATPRGAHGCWPERAGLRVLRTAATRGAGRAGCGWLPPPRVQGPAWCGWLPPPRVRVVPGPGGRHHRGCRVVPGPGGRHPPGSR